MAVTLSPPEATSTTKSPALIAGTAAPAFMVCLHVPSNTRYALARLERVFFQVALEVVGDSSLIHFAYSDLTGGRPQTLPADFHNILAADLRDGSRGNLSRLRSEIQERAVGAVLAFDAPVSRPTYAVLREAGVRSLISYWGAPVSSLNHGLRLFAKRLEVRLRRHQPDHYIFESEAMRQTAVHGRGIPARRTTIVRLGTDPDVFRPRPATDVVHRMFDIPRDQRIVVYSGHMEPRKGVRVLIEAVVELVAARGRRDLHLLVLGNRTGEDKQFRGLYSACPAATHITFGGYQTQVHDIFPGCDIGCIASTGWDSFTMSAVEMAASGLPLVVSSLQGLRETVEEGVTGLTFPPGDSHALADRLERLLDDPTLAESMARAARERVLRSFTISHQVRDMVRLVTALWHRPE